MWFRCVTIICDARQREKGGVSDCVGGGGGVEKSAGVKGRRGDIVASECMRE